MSGILDSKTRVIDSVITQEGKRQISTGGLRPVYATVSDKHSFYELDIVSGSTDATRRVYYEPPIENNNDSIIMEHDDSGNLLGYPMSGPEFIANDGSVFKEQTISSETSYEPITTPSAFASTADRIIATAIDRFTNLQTIGTRDPDESLSLQMKIKPEKYTFTINNKFPFVEGFESATTNLDYVEPLFFDEMLANSPNFKYLPPVTIPLTRPEQELVTIGLNHSIREEDLSEEAEIELKKNFKQVKASARRKMFGKYIKYHRPEPMSLNEIMDHLNLYPELRRLSDYSNRSDVVESASAGEVMSFSELPEGSYQRVMYDPDSDGDARPENTFFMQRSNSADTQDTALRNHSSNDKNLLGDAESNNDSIGVHKSEENGTEVNLTTEQLPRERVQVFFNPTSSTNNIVMQMFEVDSRLSKLLKLDVIHYGEFKGIKGRRFRQFGSEQSLKNVFFAGKIYTNSIGLPCFVNLFTIILD